MSKTTLVEKKPNHLMPEEFVKLLTDGHKSCFGVMTVKNRGGLLASLVRSASEAKAMDTEAMMEVQGEGKEKPVVFMAGDWPDDFEEDDVQPFIMLGTEDEPLVLAMLEGGFDDADNKDADHTSEYYVATEFLKPKIEQYAEMVDNDLNKLVTAMDKKLVHAEMEALFDEKGVGSIFLMFANGAILRYIKPSGKQGEYDWGWASNTLGYAPAQSVSTVPAAGEQKKKKGLSLLQGGQADKPITPAPDKVPDKVVDKPAETPEDPANLPQIVGVWYDEPSKSIVAQCPADVLGKEKRQDWYNKHAGFNPSGSKRIPGPVVKVVGKTIKDFQELAARLGATGITTNKDTGVHHLPSSPTVPQPVQLVSAEAKAKLKTWLESGMVQKIISGSGEGGPDLDVLNDIEKAYPTFSEVAGLTGLEQTFRWPYGIKVSLCAAHPESAALLIQNLTVALIKTEGAFEELSTEVEGKKEGGNGSPPAQQQPSTAKRVKGLGKLNM